MAENAQSATVDAWCQR